MPLTNSLSNQATHFSPFSGRFWSVGVPIRNIADYSPFGVALDGRTIQNDFYRKGFNGMEKDDEVKGGGNSYDFGARMYDSRVGRFLSLDSFRDRFPAISPFSFAMNSPIRAIDSNGDSVIFVNSQNEIIGYSLDNQRYEGKNLVVIIDDSKIESFKREYNRKRSITEIDGKKISDAHREALVAGLEAMGTTYDVSSIFDFYDKHNGYVEKGVFMKRISNPLKIQLKNWIRIEKNAKIYTDNAEMHVSIPSERSKSEEVWLHLHPPSSAGDGFSAGDKETMRLRVKHSELKSFAVVCLNDDKKIQITLFVYNSNGDRVSGFAITRESFKNLQK